MAGTDQEDTSLTQSITDLMISLFVVFVLLLVAYINRSYQETRQQSLTVKQLILQALNAKLNKDGITATEDPLDPLALLITVSDDRLQFDNNSSTLKPGGQQFLAKFLPALAGVLSAERFKKEISSIVIEGHTDSSGKNEDPLKNELYNLRLSQSRSYEVLQFAINGKRLEQEAREFFLDKVSANGRGQRVLLPPDSKPGKENKKQSRRVEFKIRIKSFEQKQATEKSGNSENLRGKDSKADSLGKLIPATPSAVKITPE